MTSERGLLSVNFLLSKRYFDRSQTSQQKPTAGDHHCLTQNFLYLNSLGSIRIGNEGREHSGRDLATSKPFTQLNLIPTSAETKFLGPD